MAKQENNMVHEVNGDVQVNKPIGPTKKDFDPTVADLTQDQNINFESKEDEDMVDLSRDQEETRIHFESKEGEDVEMEINEDVTAISEDTEIIHDENFPIHNTTLYVAVDETKSVNFQQLASAYGMEYAKVGSSGDAFNIIQNILKEKPSAHSVVFHAHRLPLEVVAKLQDLVSLHFVVVEKKIEQPPLMEKSRLYINELEKYFGKSISITRLYVDHAEKDTRQESLSTQAVDIVLDNPHLDIRAVY